jgi:hypothetical protein
MNKADLKIGQTIYMKVYGNSARYLNSINASLEEYISEYKISKIGNKYFSILDSFNTKFEIVTGIQKNGFNGGKKAYLKKQDIYDEKEISDLEKKFSDSFYWTSRKKLSLDQLRRIDKIIEEENKNE